MVNQIDSNKISDINLASRLKKWFNLENSKICNETRLLNPLTQRNLLEKELVFFYFNFCFFSNPIIVGKRLQIKKTIFQSEDYKKIGRNRCNFSIRFNGKNIVNYGIIKYFLIVNGGIFIALNELLIKNNIANGLKGRSSIDLNELKRTGVLNLYYSSVVRSDKTIFISQEKVISKCNI
jgi:hypothetical protein